MLTFCAGNVSCQAPSVMAYSPRKTHLDPKFSNKSTQLIPKVSQTHPEHTVLQKVTLPNPQGQVSHSKTQEHALILPPPNQVESLPELCGNFWYKALLPLTESHKSSHSEKALMCGDECSDQHPSYRTHPDPRHKHHIFFFLFRRYIFHACNDVKSECILV